MLQGQCCSDVWPRDGTVGNGLHVDGGRELQDIAGTLSQQGHQARLQPRHARQDSLRGVFQEFLIRPCKANFRHQRIPLRTLHGG